MNEKLQDLLGIFFLPLMFILPVTYLYALWTDFRNGEFVTFAVDFFLFPIGLIHGIWLAISHFIG